MFASEGANVGERIGERMCAACGRFWSTGFNFCPRDGTSLAMIEAFVERHEAQRAARPTRWEAARRHAQTRGFDRTSHLEGTTPSTVLERPTATARTRPTARELFSPVGGDALR